MRRLWFLFARRYLSSRKSLSVINIISRVSIFAVGIPVAAMVILLSVFNGFEALTKNMFSSFDPQIKIVPAVGKVFAVDSLPRDLFERAAGVADHSFVLDDNVLLEYRGRQTIGVLRGVDESFDRVVPIRDLLVSGDYQLTYGDMEQALIGQGIAYSLGIRTSFYNPLNVYSPRRGEFSSLMPVRGARLYPEAIFALDKETDDTYVIGSLGFARDLLDYPGRASSVFVSLKDGARPESVKRELQSVLGENFRVLTQYEQKASMYRIMQLEKWGIFFIGLLVLVIASFSIVGSLVMLIIDKRPDIRMIINMGGDIPFVRRIFTAEGVLISAIGTIGGLILGTAICLVQQHFGIIKIGAQTFLVDSYPVLVAPIDILLVAVASLGVSWIITTFTVRRMIPTSSLRI